MRGTAVSISEKNLINTNFSQIWICNLLVLVTWEDLMRASEYDATGRRGGFCLGTGRGGRGCECAGGGRGRLKAFSGISLLRGRPTRSPWWIWLRLLFLSSQPDLHETNKPTNHLTNVNNPVSSSVCVSTIWDDSPQRLEMEENAQVKGCASEYLKIIEKLLKIIGK